nr:helix-turn-helix transcriptional regulator [uncultured Anaerobutyricum sp.]
MNFNEKLIKLRKERGLSQEELRAAVGVSRQTISKWELAQSYPDFQKLVLLSDYFKISLDTLVKDIDVEDVRDKNLNEKQLSMIYKDITTAKKTVGTVVNIFCGIAVIGVMFFVLLIILNMVVLQ